jgi:ketosteroid isomerase-like protein
MSEGNIEIVRRALEAFNRGDMKAYFEAFDPEIEFHDLPTFPGVGVHRGIDDFRRHV